EKAPSGNKAESTELYKLKRRLAHLAVHTSKTQKAILQNSPLFGTSNLAEVMNQLNIGVLSKQIKLGMDLGDPKPMIATKPSKAHSKEPASSQATTPTTAPQPKTSPK